MKIGLIGMGVVGGNTARVLRLAHEIIPYDKYKKEYQDKENLDKAEAIFICVPTPMKPSGEMDYSIIYNSLDMLKTITKNKLIIIRSTAVIGTTDKLKEKYLEFKFAFNPEFLTEKNALEDMLKTDRVIIGADCEESFKKIDDIYKPLFPNAKYVHVDIKTAEMIKYSANVMLASQIAIANELYQICSQLDIDWNTVKDSILLDKRIGRNIEVPGPDGDLGFGGKCFPKDLNALIYLAREKQYRPYLLEEVWRLNEKVRKRKDWLKIKGATSEKKFEKK